MAEDSPQNLLDQFNTESLETAFLTLCTKQDNGKPDEHLSRTRDDIDESVEEIKCEEKMFHGMKQVLGKSILIKCLKVKALVTKNFHQILRRPS